MNKGYSFGGLGGGSSPCCCGSGCTVNIGIFNCSTGAFVVGASVQATGGGTTVSGTTGPSGIVSLSVPSAGTYQIQVSAAGLQTFLQAVPLVCGLGAEIFLQSDVTSCVLFDAGGCNGTTPPGATLTIAGTTQTLPATACLTVPGTPAPPSTTFPYTISAPNFVDSTGSVTLTGQCGASGGSFGPGLLTVTGFVCFGMGNCAVPVSPLSLTDSLYGNATLSSLTPGGNDGTTSIRGAWSGTATGNYPGDGFQFGCPPAADVPVTYVLTAPFGTPILGINWPQTNAAPSCPNSAGTLPGLGFSSLVSASYCPLNLVFSVTGEAYPGAPGGGTVTITQ